jgi:hypothetical protein
MIDIFLVSIPQPIMTLKSQTAMSKDSIFVSNVSIYGCYPDKSAFGLMFYYWLLEFSKK